MKIFKTAVWIAILYIIQAVFVKVIGIMGTTPDLMLAFSVIYSLNEQKWSACAYVMLICGILAGTAVGRSFPLVVLVVGMASLWARACTDMAKFIPKFIKLIFIMICAAALLGAAEYFAFSGITVNMGIVKNTVPYAAYTLLAAMILYPFVSRFLFSKSAERLLIV